MRRFQRIGSYAVITRGESILLTRISERGYPAGWWGLPGGGIDQGESPRDALTRELYEETGLTATAIRLVDVHDIHTQAPGRGDQYEDYHGIHLLFAVDVAAGDVPRVVEQEGTTDEVRWVPLSELAPSELAPGNTAALLPVVEYVVARVDQYVTVAAGATGALGSGDGAGVQNNTA